MSLLFPKVYSPFVRFTEGPNRNQLDMGNWAKPEFELLAGLDWTWTEKVDGTNIRIVWDGVRVTLGGRTENAQLPATLVKVLGEMFPETLIEQVFGETPCVLFGEGYGAKIQKGGGNYLPHQSFALFDVKVGDWWLHPEDVYDVAAKLGIETVPPLGRFPIHDAIGEVSLGLKSQYGERDFYAEGMVGRPPLGLLSRSGDRLLMKVKHVDFYEASAR